MRIAASRAPSLAGAMIAAWIACLACSAAPAHGGDLEIAPSVTLRHWDVDAGLPSPRVFTIAQTPDGYMWMGTYAGLVRFDGIEFSVFTPETMPAVGSMSITALTVDAAGTLWVGTENGHLISLEGNRFQEVPAVVAAGQRINAICVDRRGGLWLGTQKGIVALHERDHRIFGTAQGLEAIDVSHLVIDRAEQLWALCDGVVHVLDGERWKAHHPPEVGDKKITVIAPARTGGVWCAEIAAHLSDGRGSRVFRLQANGAFEAVPPGPWPRTAARSRIDALLERDDGELWCGTRGSGLYRRDRNGAWHEVSQGTSLARADTVTLTADSEGAVWIGTRTTGAYQASPTRVTSLRLPASGGDHVATTVCVRKDGSVWTGTDGAGVVTWKEGEPRRFGLDQGLPSLDIVAIAEGPGNALHVATPKGLAKLEEARFRSVSLPGVNPFPMCSCLFRDRDGRLWVGTRDGVVRIGDDGAEVVTLGNGKPVDATGFTQARDGSVIVLSRAGPLYRLVDGVLQAFLEHATEATGRMRAVAADAEGGLWLGSYGGGIAAVLDGTARRWSMQQNGLPSSHVLALIATDDVMWVSSENGVFGCPIAAMTGATPAPHMLPTWRVTQAEGLPEKVCTGGGQPAGWLAEDGMVWVPNGRFVAGFHPGDIMRPLPVAPPRIERIIVDGRDMAMDGADTKTLQAGTQRLEFHFTSPNTVAAERLSFRHRLMGFDPDWIGIDGRRVASYTALPPGDYRFRVETRAPLGDWQGLAADVALRIPPQFWQRRSVQAAAAVCLAALLAAAGWVAERQRSRRRLERLRLEQAREQERQRIARDIHDDIGSGLTEIVMLSDIASRATDCASVHDTVQRIADRTRTLTRAMDEVVWAVNPRNDSPEGFITYLHRWAQAFLSNAGLRVRWDLPLETVDAPFGAEVRHQLFLACKETVTNIVKHAAASEVRIRCRTDGHGFEIEFADDGRGFSIAETGGDGDGLSNLQSRLASLGGTCDIQSQRGGGTAVRFFVPMKPQHDG